MTRLIALTNLFLQFDQVKQIFRGVKGAPQKSETAMIKDVINETTASIELKLNKLYFKMALSLVLVSVLAYGVIRLIWYFENYLMLNYGQNYAVLLMVVVVGLVAAQMIYAKAIMDKVTREKREMMIEKVQREEEAHHQEPGFFAAPEKLLHQAFLGFLDGFSRTSRRRKPLELPAGDSVAEFQHRLQPN